MSVSTTVAEAIAAIQQSQSQTLPPPDTVSPDRLATVQILGQDPELRRRLGVAGATVFTAWTNAAAATASLTIARGNGQMELAGIDVRIPPAVKVTDGLGRPRQGQSVTFAVTAGGGSIGTANATTGEDGVASVARWTLGLEPGLNKLSASLTPGATSATALTFVASGVATHLCEIREGNGQTGQVNEDLPIDPSVRIVKADSRQPVASVDVLFTVTAGGGKINGHDKFVAVTTNADGIAEARWTLGNTPVPQTLVVEAAGAERVTFTATATP